MTINTLVLIFSVYNIFLVFKANATNKIYLISTNLLIAVYIIINKYLYHYTINSSNSDLTIKYYKLVLIKDNSYDLFQLLIMGCLAYELYILIKKHFENKK